MGTPVSVGQRDDGVLEVVLAGAIDFTNVSVVTRVVEEALTSTRPSIVRVDMSGVTFLDSSGIGALVSGMKSAQAVGAGYRVVRPSERVFGQLRVSGLLEIFGLPKPLDGLGGTAR